MKEKDIHREILDNEEFDLVKQSIEEMREQYKNKAAAVDVDKVAAIIEQFRGCNNVTAMAAITTSFLLMHPFLLISLKETLESAMKIKLLRGFMKLSSGADGKA